jgi:NAD(P)-dependent dehydrogenase (short-subunit alcohol dehydrogenase family)
MRASRSIGSSELSVEALRQTFEVNVFGVFRMTLLPLLKKSKHGRMRPSPSSCSTKSSNRNRCTIRSGLCASANRGTV